MLPETSTLLPAKVIPLSGIYKNFKTIHSVISCLLPGTELSIGYLEKHSPCLWVAESLDGEKA